MTENRTKRMIWVVEIEVKLGSGKTTSTYNVFFEKDAFMLARELARDYAKDYNGTIVEECGGYMSVTCADGRVDIFVYERPLYYSLKAGLVDLGLR